jgi:hypothetical protein
MCEVDAGRFTEAEALAREVLSNPDLLPEGRAPATQALADALDGQGRTDEAFDAYEASQKIWRQNAAAGFEERGLETYPAFLERLHAWFSRLGPKGWKPAGGEDESPAAAHVFLLGFPRSGTTLIETALAAHPQVTSLDEGDALGVAAEEALASLDRLATLDEATARRRRSLYWERVRNFGIDVAGRVFVDKLPLNTALLPVIAALFPRAKVLFAVRDPRDVVLSCFRQNFMLNPATFEMTTLEGAARCYDGVMKLATLYRDRLPLSLREVHYELTVSDFDRETRAVAEFLGIEWSEEMRKVEETARARRSQTPSARQLVRGLYSGAGRWRRYAAQLEPVLPILQPWIERFGYDGEPD